MGKLFEDFFSELQADMVSICLEYASNKADTIYIYCSYEGRAIFGDFFYRINGQMFYKHKLNDAISKGNNGFSYETSIARQNATLKIIKEDLQKINELCQKFNRSMPTEMKLIYDVHTGKFNADYRYDWVYSNIPGKSADDVEKEWFDELKSSQ